MGRLTRALGPMFTITAAIAIWLVVIVTVSASPRQDSPAGVAIASASAPAAQAAAPASGYAGEETCLTCHEDQKKGYHGSPHARTQNPRTPSFGSPNASSSRGAIPWASANAATLPNAPGRPRRSERE